MQMRSGAYRLIAVTVVFLWLIAAGALETRSSQSAAARSSAAQLNSIWLNFADVICDRGASADLRSPDSYDYNRSIRRIYELDNPTLSSVSGLEARLDSRAISHVSR